MIELYLDYKPVVLPADFTFDMEYENPYFTKSSTYSLDIEIPVKGIRQNQLVFGLIHRLHAPKENDTYQAVAMAGGRTIFSGTATILSVTDTTVTIQLLSGNSYFNYDNEEVYIDEMELGEVSSFIPQTGVLGFRYHLLKENYKSLFGSVDECDQVFHAFSSGEPGNEDFPGYVWPNRPQYSADNIYFFSLSGFSVQPYLIRVIEAVVRAKGYRLIRNDLNDSWLRNLYICNGFNKREERRVTYLNMQPIIWGTLNHALPHWTLSSFVDEVEKFCACIFVVDDFTRDVSIISLANYYAEGTEIISIPDDAVLDEYEVEWEDSEEEKDITSGNVEFDISYSDAYLKVDQAVLRSIDSTNHYASKDALDADYNAMALATRKNTLFVDDSTGREYIAYDSAGDGQNYIMKEVNIFGMLARDDSEEADVSLKIVPANTTIYNIGYWSDPESQINPGQQPSAGLSVALPFTTSYLELKEESTAQQVIEQAVTAKTEETGANIEVMLSTGQSYHAADYQGHEYWYPLPFTDYQMNKSYKEEFPPMSLSLKDVCENSLGHLYRNIPGYHSAKKFVITFLSARYVDPKLIFLIRNQRYVCRKLSVSYEMNATLFRYEGEFYRMN